MDSLTIPCSAMPNIGIHLLLGMRVLRRWSAIDADPPFSVADPQAVSAFLYGAILPDAGYFPRGDRLFSELAHLTRTGELARALVEEAASPVQRAHAWGWSTHVLGDLAIHPLINAAHGERLRGDRTRPLTSTDDQAGHMRLEYGLDAAIFTAFPEMGAVKVGRVPSESDVSHVGRAYRRTFGWGPPERWTASAHRMARPMVVMCRLLNRVFSAQASHDPLHGLLRYGTERIAPQNRWVPSAWNRSAVAQAVLSPLPPPRWLVDEVSRVVEGFAASLDNLRTDSLARLANHDLVTGALEMSAAPTPRAAAALRALAEREGSSRWAEQLRGT